MNQRLTHARPAAYARTFPAVMRCVGLWSGRDVRSLVELDRSGGTNVSGTLRVQRSLCLMTGDGHA